VEVQAALDVLALDIKAARVDQVHTGIVCRLAH
jgi:hypothetical protein